MSTNDIYGCILLLFLEILFQLITISFFSFC